MNGFDTAAEFLLDMQWPNLFEPASALPTNTHYRCKGCRHVVQQREREQHHRRHVRDRARERERRQNQINRERTARLAKAREAGRRAAA